MIATTTEPKHPAMAVGRTRRCAESKPRYVCHRIRIGFRKSLGLRRESTAHLLIRRTPQCSATPMGHCSTSHDVLAFVVGPPTAAGLQRITVQTQTMLPLVLHSPTTVFPGNVHRGCACPSLWCRTSPSHCHFGTGAKWAGERTA